MADPSGSAAPPAADGAAPEVREEDLDAAIETDMNIDGPSQSADPMNVDGANDAESHGVNGVDPTIPQALEARIPAKKDATLREFLGKMDDYAPIIPDAVTNYYLTLAGLPPPPQTSPQLARLLALATQKFIADIAADAYQYSRIRSSNTTSNNPMGGLGAGPAGGPGAAGTAGAQGGKEGGPAGKGMNLGVQRPGYGGGGQGGSQGRTVLTMEDLGMAVGEYGVNVKRGEFYR
ncbi:hypothetical protein H2201_002432 [Coniosporium apollinis]|uniref:Transcription initiation factor TFIID subunit 10 n=1 Tax=Coniosporium apollinis TaxID=61459 RepID=A0ABQ9P0M5_9PEZI|nr:hypothetical protein H2201_002432 [Coniosporium apollinis]